MADAAADAAERQVAGALIHWFHHCRHASSVRHLDEAGLGAADVGLASKLAAASAEAERYRAALDHGSSFKNSKR